MAARKSAVRREPTAADALRALRRELELTQQDLANLAAVTVRTVARWEAGDVAPGGENERVRLAELGALEQVTPETRKAIARHFGPRGLASAVSRSLTERVLEAGRSGLGSRMLGDMVALGRAAGRGRIGGGGGGGRRAGGGGGRRGAGGAHASRALGVPDDHAGDPPQSAGVTTATPLPSRPVQDAPLRALAYMFKGVAADSGADWFALRLGLIDVIRAAKASDASLDQLLRALETYEV